MPILDKFMVIHVKNKNADAKIEKNLASWRLSEGLMRPRQGEALQRGCQNKKLCLLSDVLCKLSEKEQKLRYSGWKLETFSLYLQP